MLRKESFINGKLPLRIFQHKKMKVFSAFYRRDAESDDERPYTERVDEPFPVGSLSLHRKTVLGYPEKEVWKMTLRKLIILHTEHLKYTRETIGSPKLWTA